MFRSLTLNRTRVKVCANPLKRSCSVTSKLDNSTVPKRILWFSTIPYFSLESGFCGSRYRPKLAYMFALYFSSQSHSHQFVSVSGRSLHRPREKLESKLSPNLRAAYPTFWSSRKVLMLLFSPADFQPVFRNSHPIYYRYTESLSLYKLSL